MHPRITEVLAHLDRCRAELEGAVAAVPYERRDHRPAPERWSVAEVLEHLALVEGRITHLLATKLDAARAAGLGAEAETGLVIPTVDVGRIADRERPVTAGDAVQPRAGLDAGAALESLTRQRDALRQVVLAHDGLALTEVVAPNPVLGPLNAYQWVVFTGAHEARHAAQIREIASTV